MLTTKRRQRRVIGETRGDGGVENSLCTGVPELIVALDAAPELYTVVGCGGTSSSFEASFPRLRQSCPSPLSLGSRCLFDIRFRASCCEPDDGVDTDVIRAVCRGTKCRRTTDSRSVLVCSVTLLQYMLSSTKFRLRPTARIPTIVCKSSCPIEICWISTFRPGFVDFPGHQSPFATNSNVL